jgi:histidinol-phosphate aminotransferase
MVHPQPRVQRLLREQTPKVRRQSKLRLDINENVVGWPPAIVQDLLSTITPGDLATYPETYALYESIARRHQVTADHVLVAAGSELVIRYLFETFIEPGAELLILDPSFAMFEVYGRLYGAEIVKLSFNRRLEVSVTDVVERLTDRTCVVALAHPNNPTGTAFSETDLITIVKRAAEQHCLVVVDEAYFYFYERTVAPLVARFANLVVTRTFSKAFGLAGVRLGYGLGNPSVIAAVQKVQPIDHASVFAARLGQYAIEHEELAWDYARVVEEGKRYLRDELATLGLPVPASHGNFVLVDCGRARERVIAALTEHAFIGTDVRLPFANDYIKLTVGPVDQMEVVVDILRRLVADGLATEA